MVEKADQYLPISQDVKGGFGIIKGEFRPEEAFLLDMVRSYLKEPAAGLRLDRRFQTLDWPVVIRLAKQHRVWPVLYWQLQAAGPDGVPPAVLAQLRQDFLDNASANYRHSQELLHLVRQFQTAQVPWLAFKGPTLAVLAYGSPALRTAGDLDLLVASTGITAAVQLLTTQGYRLKANESLDEIGLRHPDQPGLVIDLHRQLHPAYNRFQPGFESLWARRRAVSLLGEPVYTLSPEDLLAYLALHGSKHLWLRLGMVADVAHLLAHHQAELDWPRLLAAARRWGYQRRLYLALWLSYELLGVDLPEEVLAQIGADAQTAALAGRVKGWLFEPVYLPHQVGPASLLFFELTVLEQLQDRVRYGGRDALPRLWRRGWGAFRARFGFN